MCIYKKRVGWGDRTLLSVQIKNQEEAGGEDDKNATSPKVAT